MNQPFQNLPLAGGNIGIERETLRTNPDATLATTPHPPSLGKALTHPHITTDFGESLLELVTSIYQTPQQTYDALHTLHRYTQANIGKENLWAASMPCILPTNPDNIAIGYYGQSNNGKLKRLYRKGLSLRYGRAMQMIAGVHFNYSPNPALLQTLAEKDHTPLTQAYINQRLLGMVRNIQRHGWLICYLFGASPAVDQSFHPAQGILPQIAPHTLGNPHATSLRMSELGYQNKLPYNVSLNSLDHYIRDLTTAVSTPAPTYQKLGLKDPQGNYQQITTNILQISNEYYSAARPKTPIHPNELPLIALSQRGITYVELRLLDTNPYDPCGISLEQIHFLETFMLWMLLQPSPPLSAEEQHHINTDRLRIACCGHDDTLQLTHPKQNAKTLATQQLEQLTPIAQQLDQQHQSQRYTQSLTNLQHALTHHQLIRHHIHQSLTSQSHIDWAQQLTQQHRQQLSQPLTPQQQHPLDQQRDTSIDAYNTLQNQPQEPFDSYLQHYFDPLNCLKTPNPTNH